MSIDFRIEHIDPLGQGVSKADGTVTFIKKTLPNETGTAKVYSSKKGVQFATLLEVATPSSDRITAPCVHYYQCNGCDYQHTNYDKELEYKHQALKRHLMKFPQVEIGLHGAGKRLGYRNRIQLHYDKKKKLLGLMDEQNNILPVPQCLIINPSVAYEMRRMYEDNNWINVVKTAPPQGHIEIYDKPDEAQGHNVKISVNRAYASGGFTQVNMEMNEVLKDWIVKKANAVIPPKSVIYDLFGGNGNLSKKFMNTTIVVDKYKMAPAPAGHQKFFSIDLYEKNAVKDLIALKSQGVPRPTWMVIDPPRSGLKNINEFLAEFKPEGFFYIACEPTSFARDLLPVLKDYELVNVELFDLFPSTKAFETVGIFTRRK